MQIKQFFKKYIFRIVDLKNHIFVADFRTKNSRINTFCANKHTILNKDCENWICTNCTNYDIINIKNCKGGTQIMESRYSFNDISKYIISKCNYDEKIITNLRLQKILYYVQGYFIKKYDILAFDSDIEAWQYGPVIPDSYYEYCANGAKPIVFDKEKMYDYLDEISERKHKRLLDAIIDKCMSFSITSLVNKTHGETPWIQAGARNKINVEIMEAYFKNNDPLELGV